MLKLTNPVFIVTAPCRIPAPVALLGPTARKIPQTSVNSLALQGTTVQRAPLIHMNFLVIRDLTIQPVAVMVLRIVSHAHQGNIVKVSAPLLSVFICWFS